MNRVAKSPSVWRRAAIALEEEPGSRWFARTVHHGGRLLLLLLSAVAVYLLFPEPRAPDATVFERGVVAPHDVIAEVGFDIPKSAEELLREQTEAASGVPPVYVQTMEAGDTMLAEIGRLFETVDSITASTNPAGRRPAVRAFLERNRISPTPTSVDVFLDQQRRNALRTSIEQAVRDAYPRGVAPSSMAQGYSTIRIELPSGAERLLERDSLITPDRFYGLAAERLRGQGADALELQRLILIRFFQPSLVYDEERTEAARDRARAAVDPVRARVLPGERIVGAHEQVREQDEERLRAYQAELASRGVLVDGEEQRIARAAGLELTPAIAQMVRLVLESVAEICPTDAILRDLERVPTPHITVARTRRTDRARRLDLTKAPALHGVMRVGGVSVVRSTLTPQRPVYETVHHLALRGENL